MTENKTQENDSSVGAFVDSVDNKTRRDDTRILISMIEEITGVKPKMWGPAIIGYGRYHYQYDSGREGDMMRVGFSPRKTYLAFYVNRTGDKAKKLLSKLGKHKTSVACLYVNKLADVDLGILKSLIANGWELSWKKYPNG